MKEQLSIQRILRERYEDARNKNSQYSIRAFSKRVGISPASLSLVLNGKRKISKKLANEISQKLLLDPQERSELLSDFPSQKSSAGAVDSSYLQLTADQYQVVGDWRAFAILGLIEIPNFKNDPEWIAERLQTPVLEVKKMLDRLKRLEMVIEHEDGRLTRAQSKYRTTDDVTNLSLRKSHYQNLELAKNSLDQDPVEDRDFTWLTLPMDKEKLKDAKTLIRKFQDDLDEVIQNGAKPTEVYRLAIQLFPLTKNPGKKV